MNNNDTFMIGGKTMQQWEEEMKAPPIASSMSYQDAESMGLLSPQEQQPQESNGLYQTLDSLGVEHPEEGKQYEQLGLLDSWADAGKSLFTEASHILMPKDMELQYESKTKFGETVKYGYRYLAGTAGFMLGGGAIGGAVRAIGAANKISKLNKAGKTLQKVLSGKDLFRNASLAQRIGNATLSGSVAGAMADFTLYRPEENEGHLADMFGDTNNAFLSYLQTDENDTDLDAKLKNVVEGLVIGMGVGNLVEFGAKPLFKRMVQNFKALKEGKEGAAEAIVQDQINLERFANKADLVKQVQDIKAQADMNGQDASQLLIKQLHPEDNIEAQKMLKVLNDSEEIFVHSDGTWDISVNKWDDAHKVSPEEYKKQLTARDYAGGTYAGDTAISHQDTAVKHTWTNRGWIGENEVLNQTNANKITKNYQDKWQIDNKVKVEFVDGLTINGKAVEGNTTSTTYQGKTAKPTKATQTKIDKKKQEIRRLQDKITQLEGGNAPVNDELALLNEDLRIKYNELKDLENIPQAKKIPDITIQIDKNAKNPYATLRSELEHARDIAKGEVPNQTEKHFSRYEGLNEGEVAPNYVYKKAQGKAQATSQTSHTEGIYSNFTNKTGMSMYDDVIDDAYYAESKQRYPRIVTMTPDEYLHLCNEGFNANYKKNGVDESVKDYETFIKMKTDNQIEPLKEAFAQNKPMDIPMIEFHTREDGSIEMASQEGIHRAIAAKEQGITKIPVAIYSSARYGDKVSNETLLQSLDSLTSKYTSQNVMKDGNTEVNVVKSNIEQNFDNWYNDKSASSTVGDMINIEAFSSEGILDDVLDIPIHHLPDEEKLYRGKPVAGYADFDIDTFKTEIYINGDFSKEQIEEFVYHELGHAKQNVRAKQAAEQGDFSGVQAIKDYDKFLESNPSWEAYEKHPMEIDANQFKDKLLEIKRGYNEQRRTATNNQKDISIQESSVDNSTTVNAGRDVEGAGRGASSQGSSSSSVQPTQLKLDFNSVVESKQSTEEIANGLINGEVKPVTKADMEAVVTKVEQINPEISGFKFENLTKDAEGFVKQLEEIFDEDDVTGMVEAFAKGDIDTLEYAVRKQLAAIQIVKDIQANIKKLGDEASVHAKTAAIQTIKHLGDYITQIKSGFGRGLNSQKLVNTVLEDYGASRLSSWTKEGLRVFTQSIIDDINDIISLNFTRGELIQGLIRKGLSNQETREFTQFLINNKDIKEYLTDELEKIARQKKRLTNEDLENVLITSMSVPEYTAMYKAGTLAKNDKDFLKTIKNWMDGNGGVTSYYVHNLLSGVGSLAKNIGSGMINTFYFPAKKILASYDMFLDAESKAALRNEGWNTYKNMLTSCQESWGLMKEAWINGNGKLTDIGENTLNMNEGQFRGFHEWKVYDLDYYLKNPSKMWETLQNFHSAMTRAMGATDEFMSQLNYRSIARAKALNEAEINAIEAGMKNNEQWINEEADKLFKEKFDAHGKPTDVEVLNEARTILYQNNLDGTMFNYKTGQKEQMREQTFVMKLASGVQQLANDNTFVKCMFPFIKTGANILQMALDHNGLYMAFSPAQNKLLRAKTAEGAVARSQVAFGMFSLGIGAMMAFNGMITGSAPSDPKERKALFATGWRPYSFRVGDAYVSYQGYEPLHGMLGFAADCANMWSTVTNPEDEERVKHFQSLVLPTLVNNFLDKAAFRTGLSQLDLIMNPQDAEEWQRAIAQTAKGFLPDVSFVTNTKSVGKHDVMQPKTMYERVFYRYFPEKWTPMDYRRNVFGEKQSITGLLITSVGHQEDNPEDEALAHLAELGYTPSEIDDVIANTGLRISQFKDSDTGRSALDAMKEEMSTLTIQGKTLREAVRDLVTSEEYLSLPDGVDLDTGARWGSSADTKINAINSIFLMYKQRAKKNIMRDSEYFTDSEGRTMGEAKEDIQLKRLQHLSSLY